MCAQPCGNVSHASDSQQFVAEIGVYIGITGLYYATAYYGRAVG
jgi:hypothetical protein